MIIYKIKKAVRKAFRPLYNALSAQKRLKLENENLKYQLNFLKTHIEPQNIKPATGVLREYQLREISFMDEIIAHLAKYDIKPFLGGGGLLGYCRHNGFIPWDDDLDLNLMRTDFEKVIEIMKKDWTFIEMDRLTDLRHPFYAFYDKTISENPNKIIAILSSTCIHIFKGTSLKDSVNVEVFPYDFVKDDVTEDTFVEYKEKTKKTINKLKRSGLKKVFEFYKDELNNSEVFTREKSKRITYGLGNYAFTEYKFHGFLNYEDIFPLKQDVFEGINVYIPNKPQKEMESLYGNYMALPADIGISHTIEDINDYLTDNHKSIIDYRNN